MHFVDDAERHLNRVGATREGFADRGHISTLPKSNNQLWQRHRRNMAARSSGIKGERKTTLITFIDDCSRLSAWRVFWSEQLVVVALFQEGAGSKGSLYRIQ